MDTPIIHIVDDDDGTRRATSRLLAAAGYSVQSYASGDAFLAAAATTEAPGCVLLDMRMPGRTGLELQAALSEEANMLPIIFLTGHGEVPDSVRAIQRGAVDFLTKPVDGTVLLDAISRALARDQADRAARTRLRDAKARYERLTTREREVFVHLISGQLNKQVAADLQISERTIKLHRSRILEKLEVDSMAALARLAVDLGINPTDAAQY